MGTGASKIAAFSCARTLDQMPAPTPSTGAQQPDRFVLFE
jgi:hypothetical protein